MVDPNVERMFDVFSVLTLVSVLCTCGCASKGADDDSDSGTSDSDSDTGDVPLKRIVAIGDNHADLSQAIL